MIKISDAFNQEIFDQIEQIWISTGVSNPARGDDYQVVSRSLNHDGKILSAWDDDLMVGTCWLTSDSRRLYLHHMAVLKDYQNQKVGHLLMESAIKYGRMLGLQMKLEVHENNESAIHLYRKYGFEHLSQYQAMIKRKFEV